MPPAAPVHCDARAEGMRQKLGPLGSPQTFAASSHPSPLRVSVAMQRARNTVEPQCRTPTWTRSRLWYPSVFGECLRRSRSVAVLLQV